MKMSKPVWETVFYLARPFAKRRFIAGETVEDAIRVAKKLKKKRIYPIINILGEHVKTRREAIQYRDDYLGLMVKLKAEGLTDAHLAIKPSQFGIEISRNLYAGLLYEILTAAKFYLPHGLVETDREHPEQAKAVREVVFHLFESGYHNQRLTGQVNQGYLLEEIKEVVRLGLPYRLTKGTAYPSDINLNGETEIRKVFYGLALFLSEKGRKPAIATHDLYLIDRLRGKIRSWQVLLGIENKIMEKCAREGDEVGFYLPCGPDWEPYGKRRGEVIFKIFWRNWSYRVKKALLRAEATEDKEAKHDRNY